MATEEKKYESNNYDINDQSYRALMNAEIQASAAKQNALKYTQNQLNQTGYGTQGLAQSTNLGIENNYRNAMANAQNQYNTEMYNREVEDNKARYSNLTSLLDSTYDENNNVDIDAYRRIMGYEGATFDENGNADVSKMRLNNLDKEDLLNQYRETLEAYNKGKTPTTKPYATTEEDIAKKGAKIQMANGLGDVTFVNGTGKDKDFIISIDNGDGTTKDFQVEMGSKLGNYADGLTVALAKTKYANKQVGDVFVHDAGNGNYFLCVVDQNKDIRVIEHSGKAKAGTNRELAEYFGLGGQRTSVVNGIWNAIAAVPTFGSLGTGTRIYNKYDESKNKSKNK